MILAFDDLPQGLSGKDLDLLGLEVGFEIPASHYYQGKYHLLYLVLLGFFPSEDVTYKLDRVLLFFSHNYKINIECVF